MSAATTMVRVTSNNLANSQTAGFKAGRVQFADQPPAGGIGTGVRVAGFVTDFSQGSLVPSSNPLDLALEGDGLFIVEGPNGERAYARAGQFELNSDGEIVTPSGDRLLGFAADAPSPEEGGQLQPLAIRLGSAVVTAEGTTATLTGFSIRHDGRIEGNYSDGVTRELGQIRIARFANPSGLDAGGDNLLSESPNSGAPLESNPGENGAASIVSGAIELSNTDVGRSLIELIIASQQFSASAAVFNTADSMLDELLQLRRGRN